MGAAGLALHVDAAQAVRPGQDPGRIAQGHDGRVGQPGAQCEVEPGRQVQELTVGVQGKFTLQVLGAAAEFERADTLLVDVREPDEKSSERLEAQRTGTSSLRAVSATSRSSGQTEALEPKAPPTSGEITRTRSSGMPSTAAMSAWAREGVWVPSHTVMDASCACHCAQQARGSIAMATTRGHDRLACTRPDAAAGARPRR